MHGLCGPRGFKVSVTAKRSTTRWVTGGERMINPMRELRSDHSRLGNSYTDRYGSECFGKPSAVRAEASRSRGEIAVARDRIQETERW